MLQEMSAVATHFQYLSRITEYLSGKEEIVEMKDFPKRIKAAGNISKLNKNEHDMFFASTDWIFNDFRHMREKCIK